VADRDREPEREDEPDVDEPPDKRDLASCVKGVEGVVGGFEDGGREGVTWRGGNTAGFRGDDSDDVVGEECPEEDAEEKDKDEEEDEEEEADRAREVDCDDEDGSDMWVLRGALCSMGRWWVIG